MYNTITFTVIPSVKSFQELKSLISSFALTDLKKTKTVKDQLCQFVKSGYLFSFTFLFDKKNKLFPDTNQQTYLVNIEQTIQMLKKWIINTPERKEYYSSIIKRVNILKQEVKRSSFNLNLFNNISLTQFLAAYLTFILTKETSIKPEIIGWFSDRDKMTTSYNGIIYDYYNINYHFMCQQDSIDDSSVKVALAMPTEGEKVLWYDEVIRVADYLAGALAERNYESKKNNKYDKIWEDAISDNLNLSLIKLNYDQEENAYSARRVIITKKK
ncbi:hypothetical protein [Clostridium polyendosporum]|uniref:hypothetical protein n=1 Tax=Clostridium polyendosporum TaxID=69208 RepID=UPI001BB3E97D|nr:hypothetical protein [Clostridium polyendosporum]